MDGGQGTSDGTLGGPLKKHEGRSVGKCHECNFCGRCLRKKYLDNHQILHTGEKPYVCPVCGRSFARQNGYLHYRRIYAQKMPYPCELCSSKFRKKEYLNRHKQLHTSGADLYHCHECSKVFVSRQVFKAHQWRHKREKPYPCRLCPATFVYRRGLDRHSLVHMSEKSYICSVCQKNFVWKKSLKVHMKRRHSGPTESAAGVIGAADLTVPSSLPSRLRPILPHVDKEFSCHLCPAIFDCSSDMDKHVVVHIGERPHICPVCRRSFAWENNLVLHMSRRHGGVNTIVATADNQAEPTLPNDLPFTLVPVTTRADVKVEPCIPTTTLPPISASVDIKAEPSSPTTTPSPNRANVDIKGEPCSPRTTPPPVITSIDIKAEPSSPTTTLPFILTLVDIKTEPDLTP